MLRILCIVSVCILYCTLSTAFSVHRNPLFHSTFTTRQHSSPRKPLQAGLFGMEKPLSTSQTVASSMFLVARKAVYNTPNIATVTTISPLQIVFGKIWEVVSDPLQLLSAVYVACMVGLIIGGITGKLQTFVKNLLKKKSKNGIEEEEDSELKVYECEVCRMQLRPARGRAQKILSRKNFLCSNCGAKGTSFFDINDLEDPRALRRLERLKKEEEDENLAYED